MARKYYTLDELVFVEKPKVWNFKDIEGAVFGKLHVLGFAGNKNWFCQCNCGKIVKIFSNNLTRKNLYGDSHTGSCGCSTKAWIGKKTKTHGKSQEIEYKIYTGIKTRCNNEKAKAYQYYGKKGITLSLSFEEFLHEIGERPSSSFSVERVDNEKGYEKGNIRWATKLEQANNKSNNVLVEIDGEIDTIANWSRHYGISDKVVWERRKRSKWCDFHSLTLPLGSPRYKGCPICCIKDFVGITSPQNYCQSV